MFEELKKVTPSAILEDDPQVIPRLIPIIELQDVSILQIVEDSHLQEKEI